RGDAKPSGGGADGDPGRDAPGAAKGDPPAKGDLKDAPPGGPRGAPPQEQPKTAGTPSDGQPQGGAKPDRSPAGAEQARGGEKGDGRGEAKPDQKPSDGAGQKPTADQIAKLAEQLRGADPNARREAARKLEDLK